MTLSGQRSLQFYNTPLPNPQNEFQPKSQIKKITPSILGGLVAALPLLFSSCVIEQPAEGVRTVSESTSNANSGYALGYEKGEADGAGGLSRTPTRYEYLYSEADRREFLRGYEAGYNVGIR